MSSTSGESTVGFTVAPGEQVAAIVPAGEHVWSHLPRGAYENLLIVSTGLQPNRIESALVALDVNPSEVGVIPITGTDVNYDGPLWVAERVGPCDLTGISIQFSRAMQYVSADGWVCFDAVSVLAMYADVHSIYRLLDSVVRGVDERGARGIYTFVEGTMDPETMNSFRGLFDRELTISAGDLV